MLLKVMVKKKKVTKIAIIAWKKVILLGTTQNSKKLVLILAIFIPVIDGIEEIIKVLCIHYSVQFQEE